MIGTFLVCHYVKHGMQCELASKGLLDFLTIYLLIGLCSIAIIIAVAGSRK